MQIQTPYRMTNCISYDYCLSIAAIKNLPRFSCRKCTGPLSTEPFLEPSEHPANTRVGGAGKSWARSPERIKELIDVYQAVNGNRRAVAAHFGISENAAGHAIFKYVPRELKKHATGPRTPGIKSMGRIARRAPTIMEVASIIEHPLQILADKGLKVISIDKTGHVEHPCFPLFLPLFVLPKALKMALFDITPVAAHFGISEEATNI